MAWRFSTDSNEEMVKNFKIMSTVTTKAVENAFLSVPRAAFLPESLLDEAYSDSPIRGDGHLHLSAPHMYATVLEALELKPGMSFLNIGSGTGYFSMLAGFIIGTQGNNHGIELHANLIEHAIECCDEFLMYKPKMKKKICYPQFIAGNCFHIDPSAYKYDRVYCGAACPQSKFSFLHQLVKPEGFIVVPSSNKLLKLTHISPSGVKETVLSDVCFEALVLPECDEHCPKLRFPTLKEKTTKIKVYPPPGLLVSKTSARKSLARLRALQDVVDCFVTKSRNIPEAFAYVPSFTQIRQLTEKPKSSKKEPTKPPVDQTVEFFPGKTRSTKESGQPRTGARATEEAAVWSDLQNNIVWESVVDFTYSLCSTSKDPKVACLQVYTKVKRKKSKKTGPIDSKSSIPANKSLKKTSGVKENNDNCETLKKSYDGSGIELCSNNSEGRLSARNDVINSCLLSSEERPNEIFLQQLNKHSCESESLSSCSKRSKQNAPKDETSSKFSASMPCSNSEALFPELKGIVMNEDIKQLNSQGSVNTLSKYLENGCLNVKSSEKALASKQEKCKKNGNHLKVDNLISDKGLCPIKIDENLMNRLATTPGPNWTSDEDVELVQLLMNSSGMGKMSNKCLTKHISVLPSLFSPSVLVPYPKLSSYTPESLTFRALALFRIVHVIDGVLPFLCSTSPALDSVTKPLSERPYPLTSFTESSFSSQKSPLLQNSKGLTVDGEADNLLTSGIKNIRKHKEFIQRKLALHKCLQSQLKEQRNLSTSNKQIQLIEEQNVVLQHVVSNERSMSAQEVEQLRQTMQQVNERKSSPHELVGKQLEIAQEVNLQMETFMKEDAKFAMLLGELKKMKKKMGEVGYDCRKVKEPPASTSPVRDNTKNRDDLSHRYNASAIMSSLRFLLPLSNRRMGFISELLRATEQPVPDQVPVVYVDRQFSVSERLSCPQRSVFYQIYEEFKAHNINFRWNKRKCDQWWEVKFIGEGIIDQGGGFRDSLAEVSDELCPQGPSITHVLPLFVKSVNHRDHVGEYCDCYVPNPTLKDMKIFHWLGKLMGAAYRSDESLTLSFPPFIWKLLAGEHVTWCTDFAGVDAISVNLINNIELASKEEFSKLYASDLNFTTVFSDGSVIEVKDGGSQIQVNYDSHLEYCELVKKTRMMESINQVKAMHDGLLSVIPQSLLELITSQELEKGVCGFNEIPISLLKESIHYGDELSPDSDCVVQLWKVLESFTMEDRSRFLRFVTGRKRLPACITLSQMCGEKDTLPSASTCASTLMLPSYSSVQVAEKKLRYAIYNCIAIDTDTSPW